MPQEENWKQRSHRMTESLKNVKTGDKVQNIVSKTVGTVTQNATRSHPYILVEFRQSHGQQSGRLIHTAWWAEHTRVVK